MREVQSLPPHPGRILTPFSRIVAAQAINRFGDGFFTIGISWIIYGATGSVLPLGVLWSSYMMLAGVLQTVAAPLVDRLSRRALTVGLNLVRATVVAAPVVLAAAHRFATWELYPVFVVLGVLGLPYNPAVRAMIPQVVPPERLRAANARLQGVMEAMYVVGPAVAGATIAALGPLTGLGLDTVSFLVAALLMATLPGGPRPAQAPAPYVSAMWHGGRVMWRDALLRRLALLAVVVQVTDAAFIVLSVPLVRSVLHGTTRGVGLLEASLSLGVIVGAAAVNQPHLRFLRRGRWTLVLLFCLATGLIAVVPVLAWALMTQVVAGVADSVFMVEWETHFQSAVGSQDLGRVLMFHGGFTRAAQAVAAFAAAALALGIGIGGAFLALGLGGMAMAGVLLPGLHRAERALSPSGTTNGH